MMRMIKRSRLYMYFTMINSRCSYVRSHYHNNNFIVIYEIEKRNNFLSSLKEMAHTIELILVKVCPTLSADLYVFVLSFVYYYYSSLIGFVIGYLCHLLSDLAQIWTVVSP